MVRVSNAGVFEKTILKHSGKIKNKKIHGSIECKNCEKIGKEVILLAQVPEHQNNLQAILKSTNCGYSANQMHKFATGKTKQKNVRFAVPPDTAAVTVTSAWSPLQHIDTARAEEGYRLLNNTTAGACASFDYVDVSTVKEIAQSSIITPASMWPSIESSAAYLQIEREFSIDEFLPAQKNISSDELLSAESDDLPCDCCLCECAKNNKSITADYCIKNSNRRSECRRNGPWSNNYRKTVLCKECRLSLNDRITKQRGKLKCIHRGCKQFFKTKNAGVSHIMDHIKLKNYVCEVCVRPFKFLKQLKNHESKH